MADDPEISTSEWQVTTHWTAATIRTFLHRLIKKGALKFEQDGNRYLYRAAIPRTATIKKASRSFLQSVFDGQSGPLISHFVKNGSLTSEEIEQLRELLDRKGAR